jgi:hypothetical protein
VHELRLHLFHLFNKNTPVCKVNLNQTKEIEKALVLVGVGCNIVSEKYLMHDDEEDFGGQSKAMAFSSQKSRKERRSRRAQQNRT